ncbi:MAG: hypothetical protein ACKOBD_16970 [Chloroflexota bacterium]
MNAIHALYDEGLQELLTRMLSLGTFSEAKDWGERAVIEIERLKGVLREMEAEIANQAQSLEKLKYDRSKKVLGGLLGISKEEKALVQQLEDRKTSKGGLSKAINQLQDMLDFTPRSPEEKQVLLVELRTRKRKLQEEKREITQVVRGPRMNKPQEALMDNVFDAASRERRKIRYNREAQLRAGETTTAALTRQIEQAERDIQWVEKFEQ